MRALRLTYLGVTLFALAGWILVLVILRSPLWMWPVQLSLMTGWLLLQWIIYWITLGSASRNGETGQRVGS